MHGFPVFLSQRAMIRAHVLKAMQQDGDAYLAAAAAYLDPAPGVVVAIGGLQGTGKSTLARALAPTLGAAPGALVLRSDETRKRLHGVDPETRCRPRPTPKPPTPRRTGPSSSRPAPPPPPAMR